MDVQTNIPLHVLQRLGSVSMTNASTLGYRREGQLLAPASLAARGAGRVPRVHLETPPPLDHRVTLRQGLVHSLGETSWV